MFDDMSSSGWITFECAERIGAVLVDIVPVTVDVLNGAQTIRTPIYEVLVKRADGGEEYVYCKGVKKAAVTRNKEERKI